MDAADHKPKKRKPAVAAILTEYRPVSHADVIIGRLLGEYGFNPRIEVISMYTDQVPEHDMSRDKARKHDIPIYQTIAETIGAGGQSIDGVLVIGEHGDYPFNEKQQKMYPRRRLIEESVLAMDALNIRVPLFNDKHLSYNTNDTLWIYRALKKRGIPFFGGSSISITDRSPVHDRLLLRDVKEIVVTTYGGVESYGFHAMEVLQSLAEQREGGEVGIEFVEALEGADVWAAAERGEWPEDLLMAALKQNGTTVENALPEHVPNPVLFRVGYRGGLIGYVVNLRTFIRGWAYACKKATGDVISAICKSNRASDYPHFDDLTEHIEELIVTGSPPVPSERVVMTSVMIDAAMTSLHRKERVNTPELSIRYNSS